MCLTDDCCQWPNPNNYFHQNHIVQYWHHRKEEGSPFDNGHLGLQGEVVLSKSKMKYFEFKKKEIQCSPMVRKTGVQSQVESYQRLNKWYFMPPCLTLSIIRYGSRVKWSNPGRGVVPSSTPQSSSYWKGSLQVPCDCGHQLYFYFY